MRQASIFLTFVLALLVSCRGGLAPYLVEAHSIATRADGPLFTAEAEPLCDRPTNCIGFVLRVTNKTDRPLEVDWSLTQFVDGGETRRGFMWEGERYSEANETPAPSVILPRGTLQKEIVPLIHVYYQQSATQQGKGAWRHRNMGEGEKGLYLTIVDRSSGEVYAAQLMFNFKNRSLKLGEDAVAEPVSHLPAQIITVKGGAASPATPVTTTPTAPVVSEPGTADAPCYGNGTCNSRLNCLEGTCRNPETGMLNGACYGNDTCNAPFACVEKICVAR
jgi:hypothetical protein